MSNIKYGDLSIITEVGVFGDLDIPDPTAVAVKRKKTELESTIENAIAENLKTLTEE